ncbi:MAG: hypothetical protein ACOC5R_05640 [Elusimicrobiota bacterium]
MVNIKVPSRSQDDIEIKFETYRFYLESICQQIDNEYLSWQDFCKKTLHQTINLQGFRGFYETCIKRWMKIAWNTEYLMEEMTDDFELIRFNNQWKPIQSYYSVYAACEPVVFVLDGEYANGHQKSMRKTTEYLVKKSLCPWNKAFKGARGKSRKDHCPVNFQDNINIPHNLQRINVNPIEMIAKCLKVEHQHRIDDLFNKERGKYKYNFDPGLTGIIHFLYRLRIKSNYKDVEIFVSEAPEENIKGFSKSLEKIVLYTLTLLEVILIRKCKKKFIINLINEYLNMNSRASQLEKRKSFYENNI